MTTKRSTVHKIVAGHVSVATVDAATAIPAWAHVADQPNVIPWIARELSDDGIPTLRKVRFLSGVSKPHGSYNWFWNFKWTVGMWNYFRSQYLTTVFQSANVTTLQYDEEDDAIYIQSILHYPTLGDGLSSIGPGLYGVRLRFTNGVKIT